MAGDGCGDPPDLCSKGTVFCVAAHTATHRPSPFLIGRQPWTDDDWFGMMSYHNSSPWLTWGTLLLALLVWASLLHMLVRPTPIVWETAVLADSNPPATGSVSPPTSGDSGTLGDSGVDQAPD